MKVSERLTECNLCLSYRDSPKYLRTAREGRFGCDQFSCRVEEGLKAEIPPEDRKTVWVNAASAWVRICIHLPLLRHCGDSELT